MSRREEVEAKIISADGEYCDSAWIGPESLRHLARTLADEVDALTAERDEWKRRVWEITELINQHAPKVHVYTKYEGAGTSIRLKEDRLYDRACQIASSKMCTRIAEGRDNG